MTFPTKLLRLQLGGPLYGVDQWSIGFHFTTSGEVAPASSLVAITEAFYDSLSAAGRHDTAKLGYIKFNELDHITGKYSDPAGSNAHYYGTPYGTTGVIGRLPQATLCATLTTVKQRGRGHAGRVFLPGYPDVTPTARLAQGDCMATANAVATYLNAMTLMDPELTAVVWSKIGDSVEPITGVKVGDIVDTQRRRRGSITEQYTASSILVS